MKHTYISPRTLVVKMQMEQQLMAGSVLTNRYDGDNLNASEKYDGEIFIVKDKVLDNNAGDWDPNSGSSDIWDEN